MADLKDHEKQAIHDKISSIFNLSLNVCFLIQRSEDKVMIDFLDTVKQVFEYSEKNYNVTLIKNIAEREKTHKEGCFWNDCEGCLLDKVDM